MNLFIKYFLSLLTVLVMSSGCSMQRRNSATPPAAEIAVTLSDLKPMIGHWHGETDYGDRVEVVTRETSGSSAIEETLFPGTPHEMVSIYIAEPSGVSMTHYCMLGNQPVLRAERISSKEILFQFAGGTNITPGKGQYMNEMRLFVINDHHIREEWSSIKDGRKADSKAFDLWNCSGGCKLKDHAAAKSKSGCCKHGKKK